MLLFRCLTYILDSCVMSNETMVQHPEVSTISHGPSLNLRKRRIAFIMNPENTVLWQYRCPSISSLISIYFRNNISGFLGKPRKEFIDWKCIGKEFTHSIWVTWSFDGYVRGDQSMLFNKCHCFRDHFVHLCNVWYFFRNKRTIL